MTAATRRRFLLIAAGTAFAGATWGWPGEAKSRVTWRGMSLGARAQILIDHADRDAAEECLEACRREIDRLESEFSLFRSDSAIARLNASGRIDAPSGDLLQILSIAASVNAASGGFFDPTVQPLWEAYARFYTEASPRAASTLRLEEALGRIGLRHIHFDAGRIAFARQGMALTLNGIAQGYITDRLAELFHARGFDHVLVDMGEIRAVGAQQDGRAWPVTIAGANRVVGLKDRALATSATLGTAFDHAGSVGHILDPRSGRPAMGRRQVTVAAPTATLADALSTALCAAPEHAAADILAAFPEARLVHAIA